MELRNVTELITLDGNNLLAQFHLNKLYGRPVCLDVDLIKNVSQYSENALLYQVRQVLKQDFSADLYEHVLFFVNFWEFFQHKDTGRSALFRELLEKGFTAKWAGSQEVFHYVPFEKSQSQAKDCVISFIRQDLFLPVRKRLDLDIGFGDYAGGNTGFSLHNSIALLSKLYAYRGLYLTEALRLNGIEELLDADRIVILDEPNIRLSTKSQTETVPVYTAEKTGTTANGQAILEGFLKENDNSYSFDPYDGVGLISPRGAALLNRAMNPRAFSAVDTRNKSPRELQDMGMSVSFQFRMPFCKGMLHTVDFHRFLQQECGLPEDCWVEDAFGVMRNLKHADIILNQTLFKLLGLLKKDLEQQPERRPEFIQHYFEKLRQYGHSIYIVKTDRQQRQTGYARLTAQIINTLPFTQEGFDRVIRHHTECAEQYQLANILLAEGKLPIFEEDSGESLHQYLDAHFGLALDSHVESLIESCRKQALHNLYLGKLEVEGDMRFLCRDLIYCLHRLGKRCGASQRFPLIPRGNLYLPGEAGGRPCAVFRSPHLCPNENVSALTAEEPPLHKQYLGHLHRVAFVGTYSQMPDALGGADFDGDMVVVAFQQDVVDACEKNCYRENGTGLSLLQIPSLKPEKSTDPTCAEYVDVQTIENTFNSQIGIISNATMKLCAAEALNKEPLPYPSRFCAILNGVEIDAAKTGVRPDLKPVTHFVSHPNSGSHNKITKEAAQAMQFVGTYLDVRTHLKNQDLVGIHIVEDDKNYCVTYGKQEITKFSKDSAGKPYVYQLLCRWAQALNTAAGNKPQEGLKEQAVDLLRRKLTEAAAEAPVFSQKQHNYPRDEVLKQLVFCCAKAFPQEQTKAVNAVLGAYSAVKKTVDTIQKDSDPAERRTARKNLLYLLRYKYDDIDITLENQPTLRQLGNSMNGQLALRFTDPDEIHQLLDSAFYCKGQDLNPWLFQEETQRKVWLSELLDPQTACLAADFGAQGYNLMYFALRELESQVNANELRKILRTQNEDPFLDALFSASARAIDRGYSAAQICSRVLPPLCRQELETLTGETDPNRLIPLVYNATKSANRPVFWKLFSWPEIEAYLKKVHAYAE